MKYFSERHLAMNALTRYDAYDDEDRLLTGSKCMLRDSSSLDTGLFGAIAHSVDSPLPVSIPYFFYNVKELLDK